MTQAKKLKRAIRARARKTGESYTAARRHLLKSQAKPEPAPAPASRGARADGKVLERTGRGLEHWFAVLDAFGPAARGHTAAARHLRDDHGVPGWHSQWITVAWERARGLRVRNQAASGAFQVSVSRTVPASVAEVADAIGDARRRRRWLRGAEPGLARALEAALAGGKAGVRIKDANTALLRYKWDGTTVTLYIAGTPKGAASVVADNTRLRDGVHVEERRAQWKPVLDALKAHLMA
jgi:hypothetical protein